MSLLFIIGLLLEFIRIQSIELCKIAYNNNNEAQYYYGYDTFMFDHIFKNIENNLPNKKERDSFKKYDFFGSDMSRCIICGGAWIADAMADHETCKNCKDSNYLEIDIILLDTPEPKSYLGNNLINYGNCHRCGKEDNTIFCASCRHEILSYTF